MILKSTDIKRGATLSLGGYINLPAGDWTIESMVRTGNNVLVEELDAVLTPPVSPSDQYGVTLSCAASKTADWPLGTLFCDVRFTNDESIVVITPTFNIVVLEEYTHG
jgi:hypothetical protein